MGIFKNNLMVIFKSIRVYAENHDLLVKVKNEGNPVFEISHKALFVPLK